MTKRVIFTMFLAALTLGTAGTALSQEKFTIDKIVARVGNEPILYSEVVRSMQDMEQRRREEGYSSDRDPFYEALEGLMQVRLLAQQALLDSVDVNTGNVALQVDEISRMMIQEAGSVRALEKQQNMPIFDLKLELTRQFEQRSQAQAMQGDIMRKVSITPGEVETFYKRTAKDSLPMIPEQYVYAQITKYPPSTTEAKQRVRESLLEMREQVINGESRFEVLARLHSVDENSARRGGEMDPMKLEGFVTPFANAVEKLRVGQISEVVETEYGFHIVELMEKNGDLYRVRHILLRPRFTNTEVAAASKQLDSLATEIRNGTITFAAAALKYSDDRYSYLNEGLVTNNEILEMMNEMNAGYTSFRWYREQLREDWPYLSSLKVGEISESYTSADLMGNTLAKIVMLKEKIPSHRANLNEDYLVIEQLALNQKMMKEFTRWMNEKISGIYVWIDPAYRNGEFENQTWTK